jgi:predicted metal-dependent peptidase
MADLLSKLSNPWHRLSAARCKAYEHMPYFRNGIQSLVPRMAPGMGTLGVTQGNILFFDPEVLGQWTAVEAGWVLVHEYLHRFFQHAERWDRLLASGVATESDRDTWGDACEAEINDNIIEAGGVLPKLNGSDPVTPGSLNVPPHQTAEQSFHMLKKRREQKQGPQGGSQPGSQPNGQGQAPGQPQAEKEPGWGKEGSGMGNPVEGEPEADDPDARTPVEQHVQRKGDAESIRQAAKSKSQGTVPAGLAREAEEMLTPPKVRWQDLLSRAVRSAVEHVTGAGDYTFVQRARHQGALEMMFGEEAPVLPGEHCPRADVAFCVDTSGSMGDETLRKIVSEAQGVLRHMGGAKITFISIDAEVHVCAQVRDAKEIQRGLKGGGGTDFRPAFAKLESWKPRPQIVIFATDGYGPAPEQPPRGMDVIWLIVDGRKPCDWGEYISLDSEDL